MGFTLAIKGSESLLYGEDIIQSVQTSISSPNNSRARSTNDYATLCIIGRLHGDQGESKNSETIKLFEWAQAPAGQEEAYRSVTVQVIANSQCFRQIKFSKAFVVDYNERYNTSQGVGEFALVLRQKADKIDEVEVDGNLPIGNEADVHNEVEKPNGMGYKGGRQEGFVAKKQPNVFGQAVNNATRSAALGATQRVLNKADTSGRAARVLGTAQASFKEAELASRTETITEKTQKTLWKE